MGVVLAEKSAIGRNLSNSGWTQMVPVLRCQAQGRFIYLVTERRLHARPWTTHPPTQGGRPSGCVGMPTVSPRRYPSGADALRLPCC